MHISEMSTEQLKCKKRQITAHKDRLDSLLSSVNAWTHGLDTDNRIALGQSMLMTLWSMKHQLRQINGRLRGRAAHSTDCPLCEV